MSEKDKLLEEVRVFDGFKNAILTGISVTKRTKNAEFTFVTDKAYSEAEETNVKDFCQKYLPSGFTASVKTIKRVPDEGLLRKKIYEFMSKKFPAAAAFLKEEDVEIELLQSGAHFYFDIASGEQSLFTSSRILDEVSAYLKTIFCGSFYGDVKIVEKQRDELIEENVIEEEEEFSLETRYFEIVDFNYIYIYTHICITFLYSRN